MSARRMHCKGVHLRAPLTAAELGPRGVVEPVWPIECATEEAACALELARSSCETWDVEGVCAVGDGAPERNDRTESPVLEPPSKK